MQTPKTLLYPIRFCLVGLLVTVAAAQDAFQAVESKVTDFTLANGMKFIVLERHEAPVVSFYTYADVGSVQEVKGITGLAHMFEHMAFKGSKKIGVKNYEEEKNALERVDQAFLALRAERDKGRDADTTKLKKLEDDFKAAQEGAGKFVVPNEFSTIVDQAGGRGMNASTSWDKTDYFFSLPSNALELWFYLESERFLEPVLREFYKEAAVVREERRMRTESNPIGKLLEEFLAAAYKAHPYGEPVVGHMSDLNSFTRGQAEEFFRRYYAPSNLVSVVVGDVDPQRVRDLAETYFGRIQGGPKPEPLRTIEPPQEAERRITLRTQAQRIILIGYHKPDIRHPDNAVYDALSSLLSEGRSSRLYQALVQKKKVAVQTAGFPGLPGQKYPGLFLFYAVTAPGKSNDEAEKAMLEEIDRLRNELVSADDLQAVKNRARAALLRLLEANVSMAMNLAEYQVLTGDWRNLFKYLEKIDAVTPADIQRVAKETFVDKNRTVGVIEPLQTAATK